jgi:hypothetical protein
MIIASIATFFVLTISAIFFMIITKYFVVAIIAIIAIIMVNAIVAISSQ